MTDLMVITEVFDYFLPKIDFSWERILELNEKKPELFQANLKIPRNEGATMHSGNKLWRRAKKVIPGGNMLLSKRPEMFLPNFWPVYFSKSKACEVWDLDSNRFIDCSLMGVGTNILGYANEAVDAAVMQTVKDGNLSTLNCPEEVFLAEKMLELHHWFGMARLARTGGEANAVAVRIARAASGKEVVAFCGYHGWHDWYLSANIASGSSLDNHLLSGLEPRGVPHSLEGTVKPFRFNNIEELRSIISEGNVGVIFMEVERNLPPEPGFLEEVRALATKHNIVLVFDECTSGFRETFGGLHKKYAVHPDIAVFGKTLGNGYAITCILGTNDVMDSAQSTFISSTFWTERIGPVAALTTLAEMERTNSWEVVSEIGQRVCDGWKEISNQSGVPIRCSGIASMPSFVFIAGSSAL